MDLRTVNVTRYILPLREGGSLPALTDADDGFKYVLKFRGAGQREKALIAEMIGGEIARLLGFKVPELVFAFLDPAFGRSEGDEEIQDLLKSSQGKNLALHFLSGAINYDALAMEVDPLLASKIVWLDMLITNVDRTFRNTNMLMWNRELWLIDHGASLLFHHAWTNWEKSATKPFPIIQNHVLLPKASQLDEANESFKKLLSPEKIKEIVSLIPKEWLLASGDGDDAETLRNVYQEYLQLRFSYADQFTKEAQDARAALI
ncbi:HipA family kinase [Echinicola sp. 20G]|uniref:HipA family kinase n=1 Tax=Echinicola sp. 20G TaxID=2781961 RepID=UPI001910508A|nr:HipA family kinase [Echinicola sp. 20G]